MDANHALTETDRKVVFKVVAGYTGPTWGTLVVSDIHYDDGTGVTVKEFLGVTFKSPAAIKQDGFWATDANPWVDITPTINNKQIASDRFQVTAELKVENGYTFKDNIKLNFGIPGDLHLDPDSFTKSFILIADGLPLLTGTVRVDCPPAPDPELVNSKQTLTLSDDFQHIPIIAPLGATTSFDGVPAATFTVTAADLTTPDQTVVAHAQVSPSTITVSIGQTTDLKVTYGEVQKYNAIDVSIGKISPLEKEKFKGRVLKDGGGSVVEFSSPSDHTTELRRLPFSPLDVHIDAIILNNLQYSFNPQNVPASVSLQKVTFSKADEIVPIDTSGFVTLPIEVSTDLSLSDSISVRLVGSTSPTKIYTQQVVVKAGTTPFAALVAPGEYIVRSLSFIRDYTVYSVAAPAKLTVKSDGSTVLKMSVKCGANLKVPGFPSILSFGGCTDAGTAQVPDFINARASSIFKYAGVDGAGDPGHYLTEKEESATTNNILRAREVEKATGDPVLPVMISYTCNFSGGDPLTRLADTTSLAHSFGNFILSLTIANKNIDQEHPCPAAYVVNADFLGECQNHKIPADYDKVHVREALTQALKHWGITTPIPDKIKDNLACYTLAVNWLAHTIAPAVSFGWQVNLWGRGSAMWIYDESIDPATVAQEVATYIKPLGVYHDHDKDYHPHFLAVDRYERDDLHEGGYSNGYCFGPREWRRFFNFCQALSEQLQVPVMPWQIPSSKIPSVGDVVVDDFVTKQWWGTGGSYMLGDPAINSDYHNVHSKALALKFPHKEMGEDVEAMFKRSEPFDLTAPAYEDFPLRGIFAVLLGGGSTTGIVWKMGGSDFNTAGWVQKKLNDYKKKPIPLDNTTSA
ncbi:hypothetical protein AX17_004133 [Amanita inopinata Kibby_2008]|nr:hypothetical protein AX17_004133 [Amanita inopinata Kibby_2008]